jgi:hypothetical protein
MDIRTEKVQEIKDYIVGRLSDFEGTECEELHNNLFNTDYYIIGSYQAEQWLNGIVFDAMREIVDYEQDNFGSVKTDLSNAEAVVNMFTYILGEEVLNTLNVELGGKLTPNKINKIIKALNVEPKIKF